jgi:hypothetical protein
MLNIRLAHTVPASGLVTMKRRLAVVVFVFCAIDLGRARANSPHDEAFFRTNLVPILERRCLHCHGDAAAKGGLSLSSASGLRNGGDRGPAVVPGKPDESLLIELISGNQPEMPRKEERLTPEQVGHFREWVATGAHWPEGLTLKDRRFEGRAWWAFQPLERPAVPDVSGSAWVRTPVDAFILTAQRAHGLAPASEADRRTLIRRLSFDLLGLPPSPAEVDAFLADQTANAYESLVDRLLSSPHFGERWGRHWLDIVHYGDTHGYDKDKRRDHAWPYRDYVIGAFNGDLPYGRFIREQVAGDVFWPEDPRAVIATGFIAAGPWDFVGHVELREGTIDKLKTRVLDRDDMVSNTISSFNSMTIHCARCHDHKFDPISQADYYRLQAVFAGVDRGDRSFPSAELAKRERALNQRFAAAKERCRQIDNQVAALRSPALVDLDEKLARLRRQIADMPRPRLVGNSPTNGYHSAVHPQPDATAWVQVDLGAVIPIDEIRLVPARPTDFPDTPGFGFPPRFRVELASDAGFQRAIEVASESHSIGSLAQDEPYVIRPLARAGRFVRVTATRLWKRTDDYVFALAELEVVSSGVNRALGAKVTSLDSIESGRWSRTHLVDGHDSRHARPVVSDPLASARHELLYQLRVTAAERTVKLDSLIDSRLRAEQDAAAAQMTEIEREREKREASPLVYAVQSHAPRPISILRRGEVDQPGELVGPGALSCLGELPGRLPIADPSREADRRAALSDWLASPKNVLTWRSIANRLWQHHFGRGIVDTPNDFGRNGSLPSHPELLDYLAAELRDNGQSLKALHRLIVCSAVYRQASESNAAFASLDGDNRYLWRQNRRRLDAESIRDSVLSVAGTLDLRMGGPGFELFHFKDDHSPIYDHTDPSKVDNSEVRRRTIYRFTVRSVPNPFMEALDCADPNLNTPVRTQTLTALQALALWNDLFMVRQSGEHARRIERSHHDPLSRIDAIYRQSLGRAPNPNERAALAAFAKEHGLSNACRLIWNTNEFAFID